MLDHVLVDHDPEEEAEQLLSAAGQLLFASDWPASFHVTTRMAGQPKCSSTRARRSNC